jgi:hypothetical protein
MAPAAQPEHLKWPFVVGVDDIENHAVAAAVAAPVRADEAPGPERAAIARCHAADQPGEVRGVLTAMGGRLGIVAPDGLAVRGFPRRDVSAMAFGVGELPLLAIPV